MIPVRIQRMSYASVVQWLGFLSIDQKVILNQSRAHGLRNGY